jgi:MFS family permease
MRLGLILAAPFFAGFGAFMFVYALVLQGHLHYSPLAAGLTLAPMAATFLVASLLMPNLVARYGRAVITAGGVVQLAGLILLILTLDTAWPTVTSSALAPALAIMGFGQGLIMPALIRVVLSEVPVAEAGVGSGVFTTTQQVSLALGVASLGTLFVTLQPATRLGVLHAMLLILTILGLISLGIALGSRRLGSAAG